MAWVAVGMLGGSEATAAPWVRTTEPRSQATPVVSRAKHATAAPGVRTTGPRWTSPSGVVLRWVPSGTLVREPAMDRVGPGLVEVEVGGLWVMDVEVTQGLWAEVMGHNPSRRLNRCRTYHGVGMLRPENPATCVNWQEAVALANALSVRDGLTPAYTIAGEGDAVQVTWHRSADGYRLLTEVEWLWAARGEQRGDGVASRPCRVANLADRSASQAFAHFGPGGCDDGHPALAPVGSYEGNDYGLHDMVGNVAEWVWDPIEAPTRTQVFDEVRGHTVNLADWGTPIDVRLALGGCWGSSPDDARDRRSVRGPEHRGKTIGVRLARSAP